VKIEMLISHDNGKVIQKFKAPVDVVEYDPENAITIAEALTSNAFEARDGVKPVGDTLKAELVERHRRVLTQRLKVLLGSTRENKTISNDRLAQIMVETCMKEVF
jgi:hypothetical protein